MMQCPSCSSLTFQALRTITVYQLVEMVCQLDGSEDWTDDQLGDQIDASDWLEMRCACGAVFTVDEGIAAFEQAHLR